MSDNTLRRICGFAIIVDSIVLVLLIVLSALGLPSGWMYVWCVVFGASFGAAALMYKALRVQWLRDRQG